MLTLLMAKQLVSYNNTTDFSEHLFQVKIYKDKQIK